MFICVYYIRTSVIYNKYNIFIHIYIRRYGMYLCMSDMT